MARRNVAQSVLAGLQVGGQLRRGREGIKLAQQKRQDARDVALAKARAEQAGMKDLQGAIKQTQQQVQSRSDAVTTVNSFNDLISAPASVRGPLVDAFVEDYQRKFQQTLAPNIVGILKKGKPEEVGPIIKNLKRKVLNDESFGMDKLGETLGNPGAAATAIIGINKEGTVPEPTNEQKFASRVSSLRKRRELFLNVAAGNQGTKAAEFASKEIGRIDGKINQLLTGQSPIGKRVIDFKQGRISRQQLESESQRLKKGDRKGRFDFGLSSTDTRTINSVVDPVFGGIFDQKTGTFSFKNKKQASDAFAVKERASQILLEQGRKNPSKANILTATKQALKEFGIKTPKLGKSGITIRKKSTTFAGNKTAQKIKADFKAGTITRDEATKRLRALGQ